MPELFRHDVKNAELKNPITFRSTRRVPGNVPYVVDNLWEWTRPEEFPSRRNCICVSPNPELARLAGGAIDGAIYKVEIKPPYKLAQISVPDAREHSEVKTLPKLLLNSLGKDWLNSSAEVKSSISLLWAPVLTKEEVAELFNNDLLSSFKDGIQKSIHFWKTAKLLSIDDSWAFQKGEGFFEAVEWELYPYK